MAEKTRWTVAVLVVAGLTALGAPRCPISRAAQSLETDGRSVATLKDQLEKGLRARRAVEFQFLARVVQLVNGGQLPVALVQGTFSWTIKKYAGKKYLVPHFEQVLRRRAKEEKITALDNVPTTLTLTQ